MTGKRVVREVINTYCALAIKFKGLLAVALIGDESKFWVAKPVQAVIGKAKFEINLKELKNGLPACRLILEVQT